MADDIHFVRSYQIGRVFGNVFGVIGRNAALFLGMALLFAGLPTLFFALAAPGYFGAADTGFSLGIGLWWTAAAAIAWFIGSYLLQAALVRATIEDMNGGRPRFGECFGVALRKFLPIIGLSIVVGFLSMLGLMFFIVPGIILWLGWSAALPILIGEDLTVGESLSRSRDLTRGARWNLFALFLVVLIASWLIESMSGLFALLIAEPILLIALQAIGSTVSSVLMATAIAASYVELREAKEGSRIDELAAIFA